MVECETLFNRLLGQYVWNVRRVYGSIVYFEFGEPHMVVHEPLNPSPGNSRRVKRQLRRRRVFLVGDWTFALLNADWEIQTVNCTITSEELNKRKIDEALLDIEGQKLVAVTNGVLPHSIVLEFDLGGKIHAWQSSELLDSDQWCLHEWGSEAVSCMRDNTVRKADGDSPCSSGVPDQNMVAEITRILKRQQG